MNTYDVGDVVRIQTSFTNSAGVAVDPSSVTFQHRLELSDPLSYTTLVYGVNSVTRSSTGVYYADLSTDSAGKWLYRVNGTGLNAAAVEGYFMIRVRTVG